MKNFEKKSENNPEIEQSLLDKPAISSLKMANKALGLESNYDVLSVIELQLGTGEATLEIKKDDITGLSALVRNERNELIFETSDLKEIADLKKAADYQTVVEEITLEEPDDDSQEDIEEE